PLFYNHYPIIYCKLNIVNFNCKHVLHQYVIIKNVSQIKYRIILNTLIQIIPIIRAATIFTIVWLFTFLDIRLPISPPESPPTIIKPSIDKSNEANPVVNAVNNNADNCEKKIIKIEFSAACLAFIAKNM